MYKFRIIFAFVALLAIGINSLPTPDDGDGEDDEALSPVSTTTTTGVPVSSSSSSVNPTVADSDTIEDSTSMSTPVPSAQPKADSSDMATDGDKVDLTRYRWDADKSKYIRLGTTVDCPANMRFFASQVNATAGQCDCDYYQCSRPLLYSTKTKECHFAWSKGPCEESEWYAFNKELEPICEPRKCQEGLSEEPVTSATVTLSYWFVDPNGDGKCHEAGSDETCTEEDESLLLYPGDPIPKCRSSTVCVPLGRPEPQLCFKGNRRYFEGRCPSN